MKAGWRSWMPYERDPVQSAARIPPPSAATMNAGDGDRPPGRWRAWCRLRSQPALADDRASDGASTASRSQSADAIVLVEETRTAQTNSTTAPGTDHFTNVNNGAACRPPAHGGVRRPHDDTIARFMNDMNTMNDERECQGARQIDRVTANVDRNSRRPSEASLLLSPPKSTGTTSSKWTDSDPATTILC